jgi:hypothetical protein
MLIETGWRGATEKDAAQGRRLEKLRRDFGPVFLAALNDPQSIEVSAKLPRKMSRSSDSKSLK